MSTPYKPARLTLFECGGLIITPQLVLFAGAISLVVLGAVAGAFKAAELTAFAAIVDLVSVLWTAYLTFSICYAQVLILPCVIKAESRSGVAPDATPVALGLAGLRWGLFCHAVPTLRLLAMAKKSKPPTSE